MVGLQLGEAPMMIDSVDWAQYMYINVRGTKTATQPHHNSNSRLNGLHRSVKTKFRAVKMTVHLTGFQVYNTYCNRALKKLKLNGKTQRSMPILLVKLL